MVDKAWFVIHTYSGMEEKVRRNLLQRIERMGVDDRVFDVIVPLRPETQDNQSKDRKIYPGYVLVEMSLDDQTWSAVRNTPGVTGFVGFGNTPTPLNDKELQTILSQMGLTDSKPSLDVSFKVNQKARIIDGPFTDNFGIIREINYEKRTAKIIIQVFNRETSVELDFQQIEEA
jgi:transcriptional antiterminator NusG